jgi:hypothetical protein
MKTYLKFLVAALVAVGLVAFAPAAQAQGTALMIAPGTSFAGGATVGDDADVAFIIKYIGTRGTAVTTPATTTLEVGATTLAFLVSGTGSADISTYALAASAGCAGGAAGTITFTDAACDTVGEVADIINQTTNWRMVPIDAQRTDYVYSSDKKILTAGAAAASGINGVSVNWDSSTRLASTRALLPREARKIGWYLIGNSANFRPYPFQDLQPWINYASSTASTCTAAGAAKLIQLSDVKFGASGSETSETLVSKYSGTLTTEVVTYQSYGAPVVFGPSVKILQVRNCATGFVNYENVILGGIRTVVKQ